MIGSIDLDTPARALAVSAHPDDAEFGCGATLAKWGERGCITSLVVCTDGSKGSWDPDSNVAQLVQTRQREQRLAAERLGLAGEVIFLEYVDGELQNTAEARESLAAVIRRLRPTVVLGHDPWKSYRLHPDHREAGFLTCEAIVAARDPHFFPDQGLAPHRPEALLLFEAEAPDHLETIDGHDQAKIAALMAHESQFESTMHISASDDGSEQERFTERIRAELAAAGALADLAAGEAFKLIEDL